MSEDNKDSDNEMMTNETTNPPPLPAQGWTQLGVVGTPRTIGDAVRNNAQQAATTNAATTAPAPADCIRYPINVADDIWDDAVEYQEICLVGTAGQKITHIGNDFSTSSTVPREARETLKKLIFRSHLLSKMEGLQGFTSLQLLELYDNQIPALVLPPNLQTLTTLDMSFNVIRDMSAISACPALTTVYLANNKITQMAGLSNLKHLTKLDLGANRIREIKADELRGCPLLQELWLGKNKISKIQGLASLLHLKRLDIQSNRLTRMENLSAQAPILEELYLASNGISDAGIVTVVTKNDNEEDEDEDEDEDDNTVDALASGPVFAALTVLDLSRNQLGSGAANQQGGGGAASSSPSSLSILAAKCPALEELWLSGNSFSNWNEVADLASLKSSLETIYLEYNPLQQSSATTSSTTTATTTQSSTSATATTTATTATQPASTAEARARKMGLKPPNNPDHSVYRQRLLQLIPSLTQIDANPVTAAERLAAGATTTTTTSAATTGTTNTTTSPQEQARLLQERAIQRAREETAKMNNNDSGK